MKVDLFICAESAAVDMRTNAFSAFNITEEWNITAFPVFIPKCVIITMLSRDPKTEPQKVDVELRISVGGEHIFKNTMAIEFQSHDRARTLMDFQGLPIQHAGTLLFSLHDSSNNELARWPVSLNLLPQPEATVTATQS